MLEMKKLILLMSGSLETRRTLRSFRIESCGSFGGGKVVSCCLLFSSFISVVNHCSQKIDMTKIITFLFSIYLCNQTASLLVEMFIFLVYICMGAMARNTHHGLLFLHHLHIV